MVQPANLRLLTEDRAALPSSAAPAPPGVASAGSAASFARSDHVHPSAGLFVPWGSAVDGDLVFDGTTGVTINAPYAGTTTTFTPSASVYTITRPIAARTIILGSGVTLVLDQGVSIRVSELLSCPTGSAIIHADGNAGLTNGTAGAGRASAFIAASGAGGAGNTGAGSVGNSVGGIFDQYNAGFGGNGGLGSSGAGGSGIVGIMSNQSVAYTLNRDPMTMLFAEVRGFGSQNHYGSLVGGGGGGGGGGDGTNKGGGGGGGAGVVLVNAYKITGNIVFRANGGNGGSTVAGNTGGGGGGAGGYVFVNSTDLTGYTGASVTGTQATYTAGGSGGTKTGTGVAGSAGQSGMILVTTWK